MPKYRGVGGERQHREGMIRSEDEVVEMSRAAGFVVANCREIDLNLSPTYTAFVTKISKRRFLCIASVPA